jgi:hypothetical protein
MLDDPTVRLDIRQSKNRLRQVDEQSAVTLEYVHVYGHTCTLPGEGVHVYVRTPVPILCLLVYFFGPNE